MRFLAMLAVVLLGLAQGAAAATLGHIRESGSLRIGYRADAPPYSFRTANGQPAGYIVDLCREVATAVVAAAGGAVRVQYVLVQADERFAAVHDGRIDMLCDPSSVTLARRELVDFSIPTFLDGASAMFRNGEPVQRYEDFAGKRVGVLAGTTTEHRLRSSLAALGVSADIVTVKDHRAGVALLDANKIDTYFADRAIIAAMLRDGSRPGLQLSKRYFSYETYALALPRGDSEFRLLVDRTLAQLYRSGRIDRIFAKTFRSAPADEMLKSMFLINAFPED